MTHTVTASGEPAVLIEGLKKRYGAHVVLDAVDLRIDDGVTALLGPNGAGKTTLVHVLSTLLRPDGGRALVCGRDVVRHRRDVQGLIGLAGQQAAVDGVLTGTENLVMVGRLLGLPARSARHRATEMAEQFGLTDAIGRRARTYSGGMRRRLDLAMSLVRAPRVLFLDEPTTGLDPRSRQTLWTQVRELAHAGTTVLLTTQDLQEVDALADRVAVLDGGRVMADGSPEQLRRRAGGDVVELLDDDGHPREAIPTDGTAAQVARVVAALPGDARVRVRRPSLEEVVIQLTSSDRNQGRAA